MKTIEDFNLLYTTKLGFIVPQLDDTSKFIRRMNKEVLIKHFGFIFTLLIGYYVVATILGIANPYSSSISVGIIVLIILLSLSSMLDKIKKNSSNFLDNFKIKLYKPLLKLIDDSLEYNPSSTSRNDDIRKANLLSINPDDVVSNGCASGVINGTKVEFSEIIVSKIEKEADTQYKHYVPIFEGLLFIIHLNDMLGTNANRGVIGSSKHDEAINSAISEVLAQKKLEAENSLGKEIMMSYKESKLYIAVSLENTLFSSTNFNTKDGERVLREYFQAVAEVLNLLNELQSNKSKLTN